MVPIMPCNIGSHATGKPKLAVYKFSSCDGCQLQLLNLEDELLDLVGAVEIAYFLEARRRELPPPYDIGLVEGSISTPEEEDRIQQVRRDCKFLVAIGACATSGGIQALRNWANIERVHAPRLPQPAVHQDAGDGHADRRPRVRRLRAARLPGEPAPVAGADLVAAGGPQAEHPHAQPVHRVQAARAAVRAGGRRASRAWGRSRRPAAARCARPAAGPATAASARWNSRTSPRWAVGSPRSWATVPREMKQMLRSFNGYLEPFKQASDHYERLEKGQ